MALLRSPYPDLPTQPVRALPMVPMQLRLSKPSQKSPSINVGFCLRVCGLIFVIAIYAVALVLYLPTIKAPTFLESTQPGPVKYQCARVTLLQTSNHTWITSTDYTCH